MDQNQNMAPRPVAKSGCNRAIKTRMELSAGDLVIYPFLWGWQSKRGIISAEKMRPCVVLLRNETQRGPMVALLPITTQGGPGMA